MMLRVLPPPLLRYLSSMDAPPENADDAEATDMLTRRRSSSARRSGATEEPNGTNVWLKSILPSALLGTWALGDLGCGR